MARLRGDYQVGRLIAKNFEREVLGFPRATKTLDKKRGLLAHRYKLTATGSNDDVRLLSLWIGQVLDILNEEDETA